jgi:hypothetical protein
MSEERGVKSFLLFTFYFLLFTFTYFLSFGALKMSMKSTATTSA